MVQELDLSFQPSKRGSVGQLQPPIPHLGGIILLHRGQALVGAWDAEAGSFIHPFNQWDLEREALAAILAAYPDLDPAGDELRVFTCPDPLVARFNFGNWQQEWLRQTRGAAWRSSER
jgi:hypothetical protein